MSESEIRAELKRVVSDEQTVERIMDMVCEYASERASEAATDAVREQDERF